MKIIFVIRSTFDTSFCFQETHAYEYNKKIIDFEDYCNTYGFSYTKRDLGLLGIYEDCDYRRPEYYPDPTRRLEKKFNWKELYT